MQTPTAIPDPSATPAEPVLPRELPNPWPTTDQRIGELQTVVREFATAGYLWRTLNNGEQRRLGKDVETAYRVHGRTLGMWVKLRAVTPIRAILDVARRINLIDEEEYQRLLDHVNEQGDDLEARVRCAASTHRIVLVESLREVYYEGTVIPIKWERYPTKWEFLRQLIRYSVTKRPVTRHEMSDRTMDLSYLSKLASDMSCLKSFPPALRDLIVPAGGGACLLNIDGGEICIIA